MSLKLILNILNILIFIVFAYYVIMWIRHTLKWKSVKKEIKKYNKKDNKNKKVIKEKIKLEKLNNKLSSQTTNDYRAILLITFCLLLFNLIIKGLKL